jgi:hypothetical protein
MPSHDDKNKEALQIENPFHQALLSLVHPGNGMGKSTAFVRKSFSPGLAFDKLAVSCLLLSKLKLRML